MPSRPCHVIIAVTNKLILMKAKELLIMFGVGVAGTMVALYVHDKYVAPKMK